MLFSFRRITENRTKIIGVLIVEILVLLQGLYCYASISSSKSVLLVTFIAMILIAVISFLVFSKINSSEKSINRVFLGAVLILGSCYLVIFPPNTVPDEIFHFQASYKYSDVLFGEEVNSKEITIRNEDKVLFEDGAIALSEDRYRYVLDNFKLFASEKGTSTSSVVSSFGIDGNPPQTKFASVAGISLGKILGLGAYPLYYLGRLFNLIMFAALAFWAVKITPFGRNIFRAVALLPMTLHLAASYSYDAAIIGMGLLLTAFCLKAIYGEGLLEKSTIVGIGVLTFLIAPCKVIYAAISLLVLLIPKERFPSHRICCAVKGGILLLAIIGALILRSSSLLGLAGVDGGSTISSSGEIPLDKRGDETGHFYDIGDVLANPLDVFLMYIASIGTLGAWYLETAIGGSLGWFQKEIISSDLITYSFVVLLLLASLKSEDNNRKITPVLRAFLVGIGLIVFILSAASMLLGHTFVGEHHIEGVQGRYFLPIVPLLLFALQNEKIVYRGNPIAIILVGFVALNLLYLNNILAVALSL